MSNNQDTQEIVFNLRQEFRIHASNMQTAIEGINKLLKAHSDEIWGFDEDNIGLKSKMKEVNDERKREKETRVWWRGAIGIPVIGLFVDWVIRLFHSLPKQ